MLYTSPHPLGDTQPNPTYSTMVLHPSNMASLNSSSYSFPFLHIIIVNRYQHGTTTITINIIINKLVSGQPRRGQLTDCYQQKREELNSTHKIDW